MELVGQMQACLAGVQTMVVETQLQAKELSLVVVKAVGLAQVKQVKVLFDGTIATVAPQSQNPVEFQMRLLMVQLQELFAELTILLRV